MCVCVCAGMAVGQGGVDWMKMSRHTRTRAAFWQVDGGGGVQRRGRWPFLPLSAQVVTLTAARLIVTAGGGNVPPNYDIISKNTVQIPET